MEGAGPNSSDVHLDMKAIVYRDFGSSVAVTQS